MRQLPIPDVDSKYWAFRGGLDQVTPSLSVNPGRCTSSSNVEVGTNGGLSVVQGYERYDGRAKPSDATYHVLPATITGAYALGNTLTGATSAATGVIIAATASYFVLTKKTGTYEAAEDLQIGGLTIAVATDTSTQGTASTPALNASYKNLAADSYRADIAAVPGSGSVLGVWQYDGDVYAIRNNAGDTAAVMHVASAGGWVAVDLGREVAFTSGGTFEITDGATITGATSAATATVGRVVVTSGTWAAGTAAGFLYLTAQTGTLQAENLNVGANLNVATIGGNSAAVSLTKSGRYEFVNYNFGGASATKRMYGASGVHKAFEFDGTAFAFVTTGMTTDTPEHITVHKNHLFLSFGASVQHSAPLDPLTWSVVLGAGEIGLGEDVTNFIGAPGGTTTGAMPISSRNKFFVLYGNDSSDWNLAGFNPDGGAIEWTGQYINNGVYLDDRGLTTLAAAQEFGNFQDAVISEDVRPYVNTMRDSAVASCVVREKNQYRLFSSGGAALYVTFINKQVAGLMPVSLANAVTCICSQEAASGAEAIYFGSTNGMVYQMEKGTSQDGDAIAWNATLAFNHFGSPLLLKTFRKAVLEVSGTGYSVFSVSSTMGYGTSDLPAATAATLSTNTAGAQWDAFSWDTFFWDGQTLVPAEADLDGTAENVSLMFTGSSDEYDPVTLNGAIVAYTSRRLKR
jgi:hypothetical protein